MAKVFISHRGADTKEATALAKEIRSAGHEVWLDALEVSVGDQIVERMNEGLEGAAYLIVCYSSEGMAPWMTIEWAAALAAQLNGKGVKVLPARLTGTEGPAILEGTKYADLLDSWDQGITDLLRAIE